MYAGERRLTTLAFRWCWGAAGQDEDFQDRKARVMTFLKDLEEREAALVQAKEKATAWARDEGRHLHVTAQATGKEKHGQSGGVGSTAKSLKDVPQGGAERASEENGADQARRYRALLSVPHQLHCGCATAFDLSGAWTSAPQRRCEAHDPPQRVQCSRFAVRTSRFCVRHAAKKVWSSGVYVVGHETLEELRTKIAPANRSTAAKDVATIAAYIQGLDDMLKISCEHQAMFSCQRTRHSCTVLNNANGVYHSRRATYCTLAGTAEEAKGSMQAPRRH